MAYILLDGMNLYHRAMHTASARASVDDMIGMSFHVIFNSLKKVWADFDGTHAFFCLEGKTFRKKIYPGYKANREVARLKKTDLELENQKIIYEAFGELCDYFVNNTNMSVLRADNSEADDLIAVFTQMHPNDKIVIVSSDSDYWQLLSENVSVYDPINKKLVTIDGFVDDYGKPLINSKTKLPMEKIDPAYYLFEKIVRGDTSDNIHSAYPGVRKKGTKNQIGITEAYDDRLDRGYKYNNFMLQKWVDHHGEEVRVKDRFEFNRSLIDLTAQPDEIKLECIAAIQAAYEKPPVERVGVQFMQFCGKWDLRRVSDNANYYIGILNSRAK